MCLPWRAAFCSAAERYEEATGALVSKPGQKQREQAEHAVRGELYCPPRHEYVQVGLADIDWSGRQVRHHTWKELPQRFAWSSCLLAVYRDQADERYAEAFRAYVADWIAQQPTTPGWQMADYDNPLNLPIRCSHWLTALRIFADSPHWDEAFAEQVLASIAAQLDYIREHLSPRGNFRLAQALALLQAGLFARHLPQADTWRQDAERIWNDAARRQILPDGAHSECTPTYHHWMAQLFANCLRLAQAFPELRFDFGVGQVAPMFDYSLAATKPNGTWCGLQDSEGAYEGQHPNRAGEARDRFRQHFGLSLPPDWTGRVFPVARQAFLRDHWGEDATYVTFEASRWGSAHGHLGRLGLSLHALGRSLLVDPGRLEYEMSNPLGPYGKSTRAHNTANLNGWNQFNAEADEFRAWQGPGFDCCCGSYAGGYWPAPYGWWYFQGLGHGLMATHRRLVLHVHGRWVLVVDELLRWDEAGRGAEHEAPALELNWQFAPGTLACEREQARAWTRFDDSNLLLHSPLLPGDTRFEVHRGETDPPRGWVRGTGEGFAHQAAPQLSMRCAPWSEYGATFVTLLLPFRGTEPPAFAAAAEAGNDQQPASCRLEWPDGTVELVRWSPRLDVMLGHRAAPFTDGSLLYTRQIDDAAPTAVAIADGTWVDDFPLATIMAPVADR